MNPDPGAPTAASATAGAGPRELLDLQFDRDNLVALRNAVAAHGSSLGLPADQIEQLVLVAYELASNAVRHGGGRGRLRLVAGDGMVGCTVTDHGGGFRDAALAGLVRPDPTASGGRGLWLVRCIADTVDISSDETGTTAVARFAIR